MHGFYYFQAMYFFKALIILACLTPITTRSQVIDESIELESIQSKSPEDLLAALLLQKKGLDSIYFEQVKTEIELFIEPYLQKRFQKKSNDKKIRIIFEDTHEKYFKKYELLASFDQIFDDGRYNCVSASALYAYIFDRVNIDYKIISEPNHVYLIADTTASQIIVESTDPINGSRISDYTQKDKESLIDGFLEGKLLSEDDLEKYGYNYLFDSIARAYTEQVPFHALVSFQYSNRGTEYISEKPDDYHTFKKAYDKYLTAYNIYESDNVKNALCVSALYLSFPKDDKIVRTDYLGDYLKFGDTTFRKQVDSEIINDVCNRLSDQLLEENKFKGSYAQFSKIMELDFDSTEKADLLNCYYSEMMRYAFFTENEGLGFSAASKLSELNPNNVKIKSYLNIQGYGAMRFNDDTKWFIRNEIEHGRLDSNLLNYGKLSDKAVKIARLFKDDNPRALEGFEEIKNEIDVENKYVYAYCDIIAPLYFEAWGYYLRKQENKKAISIIKEGVDLCPESRYLEDYYEETDAVYGD